MIILVFIFCVVSFIFFDDMINKIRNKKVKTNYRNCNLFSVDFSKIKTTKELMEVLYVNMYDHYPTASGYRKWLFFEASDIDSVYCGKLLGEYFYKGKKLT